MNVQDSTESEQMSALKDEQQQDDDNSIDPDTFVLLFAQVASLIPTAEKRTNIESEVNVLNPSGAVAMATVQEGEATNSMEDNVAVAWINSEYYQSELAQDLETPLDEKTVSLSLESNDTPFMLEQQKNSANSSLSVESQQKNNSAINLETIKTPTPLEQNKFSLTSSSNDNNILQAVDAGFNAVQNNFSLQEMQKKNNPVSGDEALSDAESFAIEKDWVDSKDLLQSKTNSLPEIQSRASIIQRIQGEQQSSTDTVLLNPVSNNMQPSLLGRHESGDSLLNMMPQSLSIPTDIDNPEWSKQFSGHVIWLGQQGIKSALIKIHPEELGPLEINIKVVDNMASVNIVSHSQQVRDIIEQSLARLQEMMTAQGLSLSEVNVDSERGARQFDQHNNPSPEVLTHSIEEDSVSPVVQKKSAPQGLIDYFA